MAGPDDEVDPLAPTTAATDADADALDDDTAFAALLREVAAPRAPAEAPLPQPGDVLDDRFEIIAEIGRGGMGQVYLARDLTFGRRVAVKFWRAMGGRDREAFLEEARATARLSHPAIVTVFHSGAWQGRPFLVLEYLRGESLWARLQREGGALSVAEALDIAARLAEALAHAHRHRVVHRDLKPDNVLVLDDGAIKVVDFGIAHVERTGHTADGPAHRRAGTPGYMAPEQRLGRPEQTLAVDTWAFGVVLHEMLTGHRPPTPPTGDDPEPTSPRLEVTARGEPVAPALQALIARCLAPDPADRPTDGAALLDALATLRRPGPDVAAAGESPYRYLEAFDEQDAAWFFGRAAETRRLRRMLRHHGIVAVVGPSGAGKSSLVRAGLLGTLAAEPEPLASVAMRPGRTPLQRLWRSVARLTGDDDTWPPDDVPLDHVPGRLAARLRAHLRTVGGRAVVFVDQLEELFTLTLTDDADTRRRVLQALVAIGDDPGSGLCVVIALREAFLVRLGELPELRDEVVGAMLLLSRPDRHSMRESLCAPAARCGVTFEPDLVETLLDTLADEPTPLPLLQFTASRLWDGRAPGARHIERQVLDSLGGVGGLVVTHAERLVRTLPGPDDLTILRAVMQSLCNPDGTRRRQSMARLLELGSADTVHRVVEHFVAGRLLSTGRGDEPDESWVEVAHEILIARWERLRKWLDDDRGGWRLREALARTAAHWDARQRPDSLLWTEGLLIEVAELEASWSLSDLELAFVAQSRQCADERAHEAHQTRVRVELARSRELAAAATGALTTAPVRAMLLAREAVRIAPSVEATSALVAALDAAHERRVIDHDSRVATLALSPSGDRLATATLEPRVDLFELESGRRLHRLEGHDKRVTGATFSSDGATLLTWSLDGTARLWSVASGHCLASLEGHEDRVVGATFSPDGRAVMTWSFDGTVRLWDRDGGRPRVTLDALAAFGRVAQARLLPDGRHVVACGQAPHACLWSSDGELVGRLDSEGDRALDVQVAPGPDGGRVLVVGTAPIVGVWHGDGRGLEARLTHEEGRVTRAVFDHAGRRVAVGLADGRVALHTLETLADEPALWLEGHTELVHRLCFSPDDLYLASAALDTTVRVWRHSGVLARTFHEHRARVTSMGFAPGRRPRLWTASLDGRACVQDVHGEHVTRLIGHTASINVARMTGDGRHVVTASDDATVRVWSVENEPMVCLRGHGDAIATLAFAPEREHLLLSGSTDATARLWDLTDPATERLRMRHLRRVRVAAWSPDGTRIATATDEWLVTVFDRDGRPMVTLDHDREPVVAVSWTPDGARLVTAAGSQAHLWTPDGQRLARFEGHDHAIEVAQVDPTGRYLVTASLDRTARVWSLTDPSLTARVLAGHRGRLTCAAFGPTPPDAAWQLATADSAGRVALWREDAASARWSSHHEMLISWLSITCDGGALVMTSWDGTGSIVALQAVRSGGLDDDAVHFEGHEGPIVTAALSPDGQRLATGGEDGTARLWRTRDGALEAVVRIGKRVSALAWSRDGSRLAVGTMSGEVRVIVAGHRALAELVDARGSRPLSAEDCRRYGIRTTA